MLVDAGECFLVIVVDLYVVAELLKGLDAVLLEGPRGLTGALELDQQGSATGDEVDPVGVAVLTELFRGNSVPLQRTASRRGLDQGLVAHDFLNLSQA